MAITRRGASFDPSGCRKMEIVTLEINFGKDKKEDIVVYQGDDPRDLAFQFVEKHSLKASAVVSIQSALEGAIGEFRRISSGSMSTNPRSVSPYSKNEETKEEVSHNALRLLKTKKQLGTREVYRGQTPIELQNNDLLDFVQPECYDEKHRMLNDQNIQLPDTVFLSEPHFLLSGNQHQSPNKPEQSHDNDICYEEKIKYASSAGLSNGATSVLNAFHFTDNEPLLFAEENPCLKANRLKAEFAETRDKLLTKTPSCTMLPGFSNKKNTVSGESKSICTTETVQFENRSSSSIPRSSKNVLNNDLHGNIAIVDRGSVGMTQNQNVDDVLDSHTESRPVTPTSIYDEIPNSSSPDPAIDNLQNRGYTDANHYNNSISESKRELGSNHKPFSTSTIESLSFPLISLSGTNTPPSQGRPVSARVLDFFGSSMSSKELRAFNEYTVNSDTSGTGTGEILTLTSPPRSSSKSQNYDLNQYQYQGEKQSVGSSHGSMSVPDGVLNESRGGNSYYNNNNSDSNSKINNNSSSSSNSSNNNSNNNSNYNNINDHNSGSSSSSSGSSVTVIAKNSGSFQHSSSHDKVIPKGLPSSMNSIPDNFNFTSVFQTTNVTQDPATVISSSSSFHVPFHVPKEDYVSDILMENVDTRLTSTDGNIEVENTVNPSHSGILNTPKTVDFHDSVLNPVSDHDDNNYQQSLRGFDEPFSRCESVTLGIEHFYDAPTQLSQLPFTPKLIIERKNVTSRKIDDTNEKKNKTIQIQIQNPNNNNNDISEEERRFNILKSACGKNDTLVPKTSTLVLNKVFQPELQSFIETNSKFLPSAPTLPGHRLYESGKKSRLKREKKIMESKNIEAKERKSSQFTINECSLALVNQRPQRDQNKNSDVCTRLYESGLKNIREAKKQIEMGKNKRIEWCCTRCRTFQVYAPDSTYGDPDTMNSSEYNDVIYSDTVRYGPVRSLSGSITYDSVSTGGLQICKTCGLDQDVFSVPLGTQKKPTLNSGIFSPENLSSRMNIESVRRKEKELNYSSSINRNTYENLGSKVHDSLHADRKHKVRTLFHNFKSTLWLNL